MTAKHEALLALFTYAQANGLKFEPGWGESVKARVEKALALKSSDVAPPGHVYIAVGPNCWGRSITAKQALAYAKVHFGRWAGKRPLAKYFVVKCCPASAEVSAVDGSVSWLDHDAKNCPYCEVGKS